MSDEELSDEQILQIERKILGYDAPRKTMVELRKPRRPRPPGNAEAPRKPTPMPKEFVEVVRAGISYHFMHVIGPNVRKHLKTVTGHDRATVAAQEYIAQGLRVIWK